MSKNRFQIAHKHRMSESIGKLRNIAFKSIFEERTGIDYDKAEYLKDHPILKLQDTYPDIEPDIR